MFKNPGEKIKAIAVVVFWITVIVDVLIALVIGIAGQLLVCLGLIIVVPLFEYINTLFFIAFGELVQNSSCLVKAENENKKYLSEIYREERDISGYLFDMSEKEEQNK